MSGDDYVGAGGGEVRFRRATGICVEYIKEAGTATWGTSFCEGGNGPG